MVFQVCFWERRKLQLVAAFASMPFVIRYCCFKRYCRGLCRRRYQTFHLDPTSTPHAKPIQYILCNNNTCKHMIAEQGNSLRPSEAPAPAKVEEVPEDVRQNWHTALESFLKEYQSYPVNQNFVINPSLLSALPCCWPQVRMTLNAIFFILQAHATSDRSRQED